jgi:dUTP pyrophosphatase
MYITRARGVAMPKYMTPGAAGFDIYAHLESDLKMVPNRVYVVPTGLFVQLPHGHELQVRSRSGLVKRHDVGVANAPGTIDSDYRGEVKVLLKNCGSEYYTVNCGERIAQGVVVPVLRVDVENAGCLSTTDRGSGGFGSTGLF